MVKCFINKHYLNIKPISNFHVKRLIRKLSDKKQRFDIILALLSNKGTNQNSCCLIRGNDVIKHNMNSPFY